jgi:CHAD domain-containing protein
MGKQIPTPICEFGARFMLAQVHNLEDEIEGVQLGRDIECVHRMRVASRRLSNGLKLFKDCLSHKKYKKWRDEVRKVLHALGKARDLDIQITQLTGLYEEHLDSKYKPGYNRLLLRLKQSRTKAQKKINKTLFKLSEGKALDQMTHWLEKRVAQSDQQNEYSPDLYQKAYDEIEHALGSFLKFRDAVDQENNADKLHAMRIAGKHLRYTMELFAPIYDGELTPFIVVMKNIQDLLGAFHDNDVWVNWLPKFIDKERERIEDYFGNSGPLERLLPGFHNLMENREVARDAALSAFRLEWRSLLDDDAWQALESIITPTEASEPDSEPVPDEESFEVTEAAAFNEITTEVAVGETPDDGLTEPGHPDTDNEGTFIDLTDHFPTEEE